MDNQNSQIVGKLFDTVGYSSDKDLRTLIDNLNLEQSIIFINKSLEFSYNKGIFTMVEAELVSKCLAILNSKMFVAQNESEN